MGQGAVEVYRFGSSKNLKENSKTNRDSNGFDRETYLDVL